MPRFLCRFGKSQPHEQVIAYPGEDEMSALAEGGLRVLKGEEEALVYNAQEIIYI